MLIRHAFPPFFFFSLSFPPPLFFFQNFTESHARREHAGRGASGSFFFPFFSSLFPPPWLLALRHGGAVNRQRLTVRAVHPFFFFFSFSLPSPLLSWSLRSARHPGRRTNASRTSGLFSTFSVPQCGALAWPFQKLYYTSCETRHERFFFPPLFFCAWRQRQNRLRKKRPQMDDGGQGRGSFFFFSSFPFSRPETGRVSRKRLIGRRRPFFFFPSSSALCPLREAMGIPLWSTLLFFFPPFSLLFLSSLEAAHSCRVDETRSARLPWAGERPVSFFFFSSPFSLPYFSPLADGPSTPTRNRPGYARLPHNVPFFFFSPFSAFIHGRGEDGRSGGLKAVLFSRNPPDRWEWARSLLFFLLFQLQRPRRRTSLARWG